MADFSARMAATAKRLITGKGQSITITRTTPGTYDPATGGLSAGLTTSQTVYAGISPASGGTVQAFDIKYEQETLIMTNLRSVIISAEGITFAPAPGDVVTNLESASWTIIGVTPQSAQGSPIIYSFTVMK